MDHHGATGPSLPARWWGPATTVASADVMNQLCRVCGEPAAGFHFGAFTCEGCKSFFGRTYNNLSSVSECKNNGECVINKKNRTSCKACRLRKCLLVGMSKSGSRYGRRSNWFKIHCLLQEQQLQQHQQQTQLSLPKKPWPYAKNAAILDIDNNNTCSEATSESPPFTVTPHGLSVKTPDNSFWSRSAPFTVPHPYFISPFLQNPLQPVTHNYLLPFLPIRPPMPLEPLVITSPPSSLQSSPNSALTPKKERVAEESDTSLPEFKSLGPVQEQPIDLSSANAKNSDDESDRNSCSSASTPKNASPAVQPVTFDRTDLISKSVAPLDLRCTKS